ncbi:MAG: xylanase [Oscillospiraceae bacterium]|jgi:oligosaccharide reducing-end xylanase|nr:xylanase [Oscillospiraceae bacterium]
MGNAVKTGKYANLLAERGYPEAEIRAKIESAFAEIYFGEHRIYFENDDGTGYMVDTGNDDVRTEGQSYGMMQALQMNRKDVFDRIWLWTKKYMYQHSGENAGYFAWSCKKDGARNSEGPAPDGEEYFAMALLFAERRWGNGAGVLDYGAEGRAMLREMVHKEHEPMFDPATKLIRFVPNAPFTDPSYHLPHFYELFAEYGNPEDAEFFRDAARLSREFLRKTCDAGTGLNPNQANYDGTPTEWNGSRSYFYSDAYRTAMNIALDFGWYGADEWQPAQAEAIQRFFLDGKQFGFVHETDGTVITPQFREPDASETGMLHPLGLMATTACSSLAAEKYREHYIKLFWGLELRRDKRRYYDNLLYFFCLLALAGEYRAY